MYETDRLILRALKSSDIDDLLSVDTEEIRRLTSPGYNIPRTPQQTLEDFESYAKPPNLFCIITHKGSKSSSTWSSSNDERGAFMGFVMLRMANQKNKEGEVGIVIGDKWQGKGYGTEVLRWLISFGFKQLGLHRIALDASAINEGAIALYRRLGFVEEGRRREANWVDGKWDDVIQMALLDREWDWQKSCRKELVAP